MSDYVYEYFGPEIDVTVYRPKGRKLYYWTFMRKKKKYHSRGGYTSETMARAEGIAFRRELEGQPMGEEPLSGRLKHWGTPMMPPTPLEDIPWLAKQENKTKTFCEGLEDYIDARKPYEGRRWNRQKRNLYYFCWGEWLHKPLSSITTEMIEQFVSAQVKKGKKPRTINGYLARLKSFMRWAKKKRYIDVDPTEPIDLLPVDTIRPYVPPVEDINRVQLAMEPKHRPVFVIAKWTFARISSILNLTWDDIDMEKRIIYFRHHKSRGGNERVTAVPMVSKELFSTLENLILKRDKRCEWVFPNPKTWKPYDNMRRPLIQANGKAKTPRHVHWHDLRRWGATQLAASGEPLMNISRVLGHSELRTTEIYLGTLHHEIRETMERFAQRFEGNETKVRESYPTD